MDFAPMGCSAYLLLCQFIISEITKSNAWRQASLSFSV